MNWFLVALIGPVLYAVTNHIDKHLLEKYFKNGEAGAIVIFSALFGIFAIPIVYLIEPNVLSMEVKSIAILIFSGALSIVCLILYYKALKNDEASVVVPFYQTIPIFGFFFGYFILNEILTEQQLLACGMIILGASILSFDITKSKVGVKKRVVALMLGASFLYAVVGVIFKMVAIEDGFWVSMFWNFVGTVLMGIILFVYNKAYRLQFLQIFKHNSWSVISLNSLNEILFVIAEGAVAYATLLAPIALVMTVNGFQPLFVFLFGILITLFFPKAEKESLSRNVIAQKILAIGIITIGTVVLGMSGAL